MINQEPVQNQKEINTASGRHSAHWLRGVCVAALLHRTVSELYRSARYFSE